MTDRRMLTEGSLWKNVFLFFLPLIASNLLQMLFSMSDLMVVGNFAENGAEALGCIGSNTNLVYLVTGTFMGLGSGVNVLTARYLGARSDREVEETVHTSLVVCLMFGVVTMAVAFLFSAPLLRLLGTKEVLFDGALTYFRIYLLGAPAMAIYNCGCGVFSAAGDTKTPLLFMAISGILNTALNLVFVIVLRVDGVVGVGVATVMSQYMAAAMITVAQLRRTDSARLILSHLRIVPEKARLVLSIGLPTAVQNAIFQTANLFIQGGVNTFDAVVVEGSAIVDTANGIVFGTLDAIYVAISSFMSQNYGARNKDRVRRSYAVSMTYALGAALTMSLLFFFFGRGFLGLFNQNPAVLDAGMYRLRTMCYAFTFAPLMDGTIAACRGLGKTTVPTVLVLIGACAFRIVWIFTVFAYFRTVTSLYLLYLFSWSLTGLAEILYFRHIWKNLKI